MGRLARILAAWTLVLLAAAPAARASEREGMRVHIIHGYAASPADHWFPWLERELERRGARVDIVELPASDAPRPEAWLQALEVQVGRPDRNTFFVAHSLGGITLLRYLESLQPEPEVGGYILVSGFNDRLAILPQLDGFVRPELDHDRLARIASARTVIAARDDTIVPYGLSLELADALQARFVTVERGGHFLGSDGFNGFPLVLQELERAMEAGR